MCQIDSDDNRETRVCHFISFDSISSLRLKTECLRLLFGYDNCFQTKWLLRRAFHMEGYIVNVENHDDSRLSPLAQQKRISICWSPNPCPRDWGKYVKVDKNGEVKGAGALISLGSGRLRGLLQKQQNFLGFTSGFLNRNVYKSRVFYQFKWQKAWNFHWNGTGSEKLLKGQPPKRQSAPPFTRGSAMDEESKFGVEFHEGGCLVLMNMSISKWKLWFLFLPIAEATFICQKEMFELVFHKIVLKCIMQLIFNQAMQVAE